MLDPRTELAVLFSVGTLAIVFDQPGALFALFALVALSVAKLFIRPKLFLSVVVLIWGTAFSQAIFYDGFPKTVVLKIFEIPFYKEGFVHGTIQSMRFLSVMLAGIGFVSRCSVSQIFFALLALRIPFFIALMGVTAARTVPQITSEILIVRRACRARGGPIWRRNPYDWLELELRLLQTVVIKSWRRSINMAEALTVRGFDPCVQRTQFETLNFKVKDWCICLFLMFFVGMLLVVKAVFLLYRFDLYYDAQWMSIYAFARYWM